MQNIQISPSIEADPKLGTIVRRANDLLEKAVGPISSPRVSAHWTIVDDAGTKLLRLELSDFTGTTDGFFRLEDLKNDWYLEGRMLKIWGDLLQVRAHKQVEKIRGISAESEPVA